METTDWTVRDAEALDAAEAIPMPETHLEGERAARFTLAAERMLEQLYAPPILAKPAKPAKAETLPTPEPRLPRGFASWDDHRAWQEAQPESQPEFIAWLKYDLDKTWRREARNRGRWKDGTPWNPEDPNYGCGYIYARVEGFDPEAALHPRHKSEPWQIEAANGPWPPT